MNGARKRKEALPQWLYRAGEVVTTLVAGPRGVTVKRGGGDHRTDREERWWGSQGVTKELELSNLLLVFFMYGDCTWHMAGIVKSDSGLFI